LVSLARTAKAAGPLSAAPFTINVLKASQLDIALQFAGRPRDGLRVTWQDTAGDLAPVLAGALATFRCRPWHAYDGGDHVLQLGQVAEAGVSGEEEPLLFDRGRFAMVGLSLFDHPRVLEADPVIGGGIIRSHLVHHLAAAS
jgi:flavin reductase (DIM6/NTAB) family NADH-FMN oxidoreductase RutF